jgi:hypothetical protein
MHGILRGELNLNWKRVVEIFTTAQTEAEMLHTVGEEALSRLRSVQSLGNQWTNQSVRRGTGPQ